MQQTHSKDLQQTAPNTFLLWSSLAGGKDGELPAPPMSGGSDFKSSSGEWKIDYPETWTRSTTVKQATGILGKFTVLQMKFKLTRSNSFLINSFVFPAIVYWLMSWCGLFIAPEAVPARAAAGLIPPLMLGNLRASLNKRLPPLLYNTRLTTYVNSLLILALLQLMMFIIYNRAMVVSQRKKMSKQAEVKKRTLAEMREKRERDAAEKTEKTDKEKRRFFTDEDVEVKNDGKNEATADGAEQALAEGTHEMVECRDEEEPGQRLGGSKC